MTSGSTAYAYAVDVTAVAQVLTMVLAAAAIIWQQQRSVDKLRAETRDEFAAVRADVAAVRVEVAANGQRLARIEGYFGMGMPEEAAAAAAGARFAAAEQVPRQG